MTKKALRFHVPGAHPHTIMRWMPLFNFQSISIGSSVAPTSASE
jgi:hypothetical protein